MHKITFLLFFCFSTILFSQSKEFIIFDKTTQHPINLAQILYPDLEIGSISNEDGKVKIPLHKKNIVISHINYETKELLYVDFIKKDSIYLSPNTNTLDEVVLYNVDVLQKVTNILEKTYLKEYSTKKVVHKSTYKETFSVNDSLSRLFQVQLDWWSKNSLFKGKKPIDKENKIHLATIDYSKIKKIDDELTSSNGAYIENAMFFQFAHLNIILSLFKDMVYDLEINTIEKNNGAVNIYFDAVFRNKGKEIYKHKNSLLVFDSDYKHIKYLKFNMVYKTEFQNDISTKSKIPFQKKTTKHILELSFKKLKNDKLSLSYYTFEIFGVLKTKKYEDEISSKVSLFINESKLGGKLKKEEIDFYKPFYENITINQNNRDVKFLLTKKEKAFLDKEN